MKNKPTYTFIGKNFGPVVNKTVKNEKENKRYKLEISQNREEDFKGERCLVILKNPSKAGLICECESDKTVNTVCQYLYDRTDIINANTVVVMNLFPVYQTDSKKLHDLKRESLVDTENKNYLKEEIKKADKIIVAWGAHPVKCKPLFDEMKAFVSPLIKDKLCFQMKHPSPNRKPNPNRPLHGQVWGYQKYKLVEFNSKNLVFNFKQQNL